MYAGSMLIIVASVVTYQLAQRQVPTRASAWVTLVVAYTVGLAISIVGALMTGGGDERRIEVPWAAALFLGVAVVCIEFGYLQAYRAGWKLSTTAMVAGVAAASVLTVIGLAIFEEHLGVRHGAGLAACVTGLVLLAR
jgi:drug/metabolite transporter (DMT)-like permease